MRNWASDLGNPKTWAVGFLLGVLAVTVTACVHSTVPPTSASPEHSVVPAQQAESVPPPAKAPVIVEKEETDWPINIRDPEVSCVRSEIYVVRGKLSICASQGKALKQGELLYRQDETIERTAIDELKISLAANQATLASIHTSRLPFAKQQLYYAEQARATSGAANVRRPNTNIRAMLVPLDLKIAEAQAAIAEAEEAERQTEFKIRQLQLAFASHTRALAALSVPAPFAGTVVSVEHFQNVITKGNVPVLDEYYTIRFQCLDQLRLRGSITMLEFKRMKQAGASDEFAVKGTLSETKLEFHGKIESVSPDASDGVVRLSVLFENPRLNSPAWKERQFRFYPGELAVASIDRPANLAVDKR